MKRKFIFAVIFASVSSVALGWALTQAKAEELSVPIATDEKQPAGKQDAEKKDAGKGEEKSKLPEAVKKAEVFTYVVVKRDTLWDISKRHLNNPFKWPGIWKLNPQIVNPDLIYPGDIVRIAPGGEVEAGSTGKKESAATLTAEAENGKTPVDLKVVALEPEKRVVLEQPVEEGASAKQAPAKSAEAEDTKVGSPTLDRKGFVSNYDLDSSGIVLESKEKKHFASKGDEVFVSFKKKGDVKPGGRYFVYTVGEKITHPSTKKEMGYIVDILGVLEVTRVTGVMEGKVEKSFKEIANGARLMPYKETVKEVLLADTFTNVRDGYILASLESRMFLSKGDVVYIDIGASGGIKTGNKLRIYRLGEFVDDPISGKSVQLSDVELGELVVMEVGTATSSAIITKSLGAIHAADRIGGVK